MTVTFANISDVLQWVVIWILLFWVAKLDRERRRP